MNTERVEKDFSHAYSCEACREIGNGNGCVYYGSIGKSLLGRELSLLRLGRGKRNIIYVGTHHAMEWHTGVVLILFADDYVRRYSEGDSYVKHLFEEFSIWVIPVLNPDGVELRRQGGIAGGLLCKRLRKMNGESDDFTLWQANARGVDLNHNYNSGFSEYKKLEEEMGITCGSPTKYSGEFPESEPESAALAVFTRTLSPEAVVSLHTQGEEIYYTGGGVRLDSAEKKALSFAGLTGYEPQIPTGTAAYGGYCDYTTEKLGIPSLTVECGLGENPLPNSAVTEIYGKISNALFSFPEF